jgi:hypothetical protein
MVDTRQCEQCGNPFTPRREHARFCSARCRVAWNRANMSDPADELSPLQWCIGAMNDITLRLPSIRSSDQVRAFTAIAEAVWWVTIVDATLLRHHHKAYDRVMADQPPAERALVEATLAGLRFVRNRMGQDADLADFVLPEASGRGPGGSRLTGWRWKSLPAPVLAPLTPRGQAWEMARYEAYQEQLAGQTIANTFSRAAAFLNLTAARAALITSPATG